MGDAVSWTALGVAIPSTIALIGVGFWCGTLHGKVNNGLTSSVKTILQKLDRLPCLQPHCPTEESPSPDVRPRPRSLREMASLEWRLDKARRRVWMG